MKVKLIRRTFIAHPDWPLLNDDVPMGTIYDVLGYQRDVVMVNQILGKRHLHDCYLVIRPGTTEGYMPTELFEVIQ